MNGMTLKLTQMTGFALVVATVFGMYQDPAFLWLLATQAWTCL